MIVDDESDIILPIKIGLEDNGFEVDAFSEPLLALSNFKANSYDLVILDIKMPDMNGFELYREMRKIDEKIKVFFFTATETYYEDLKEIFPTIDKRQFIIKPLAIEDLEKKNKSRTNFIINNNNYENVNNSIVVYH
ncbi:MAG: response regulator [Nitrososphaeraceae archaeon]